MSISRKNLFDIWRIFDILFQFPFQPPTPPCKNVEEEGDSQPDHEVVNTIRKHLFDSPARSTPAKGYFFT